MFLHLHRTLPFELVFGIGGVGLAEIHLKKIDILRFYSL
jgi:hypothetical protein